MTTLIIKGANNSKIQFDALQTGYMSVLIEKPGLRCSCSDYFGNQLPQLQAILEEIAKDWQGWNGEKWFGGDDQLISIGFRHNKKNRIFCDYELLNNDGNPNEDDADMFVIKGTMSFEPSEFLDRDFSAFLSF